MSDFPSAERAAAWAESNYQRLLATPLSQGDLMVRPDGSRGPVLNQLLCELSCMMQDFSRSQIDALNHLGCEVIRLTERVACLERQVRELLPLAHCHAGVHVEPAQDIAAPNEGSRTE